MASGIRGSNEWDYKIILSIECMYGQNKTAFKNNLKMNNSYDVVAFEMEKQPKLLVKKILAISGELIRTVNLRGGHL